MWPWCALEQGILDTNMQHIPFELREKVFDTLSSFLDTALTLPLQSIEWELLHNDLKKIGLNSQIADAFISWASTSLDAIHKGKFPYRVLHEMEKELITKEAYGCMLEAIRLGFIETTQTEFLLEEMALRENLPISLHTMKRTLVKNWFTKLVNSGILKSH